MPEAFRALQAGKLPRKAGLILVRHGSEYNLTLQAETLAVSGAALPKIEGASGRELHDARIDALRHLVETLDLLYDAYGRRRTGPDWTGELAGFAAGCRRLDGLKPAPGRGDPSPSRPGLAA